MAKMIPQDVTQLLKPTNGEKALFKIIRKYTPDSWICYAGQRLSTGTTPDFVVIAPEIGVLVIEEKGLSIDRVKEFTTETWTVIRDGAPQKETHPLRQARNYTERIASTLRKYKRLVTSEGRLKFVFGHGVVLSNITHRELNQTSIFFTTPPISTFDPSLVLCKDELPNIRQKKSDLAEKLIQMNNLFKFKPLNDEDIQTIRGALFPEIMANALGNVLMDVDAHLQTLTIEQEQIARGIGSNDKLPHRLVKGVAGCGKSIILRVRTTDIAQQHPEWNILLTFFTRSLKKYLGKNLPRNVDVMTIGQSLYQQFKHSQLDTTSFDVTSIEGWKNNLQKLINGNLSKGVYQAIFLDESQDLTDVQADFLRHLLSEETNCAFFCGDNAQNIFHKTLLNWKTHGFKFQGRTGNSGLSVNFRNTVEIYEYAKQFLIDYNENDAVEDDSEPSINPYSRITFIRNGPVPILRNFASSFDENKWIIDELSRLILDENVSAGRICILHPNATKRFPNVSEGYLNPLKEKGIPYYWLSEDNNSKIKYDLDDNRVTLSTPDSGKGLEWDVVFMPAIEKYGGDHPNNLRFVAAMRAKNILFPSKCI